MNTLSITLIIGVIMLISFIWAKIPYGMTAVLCCLALEMTGVLTSSESWSGFGDTTVFLFASIFILSAGLMKTSFVSYIQKIVNRFGNNEKKILWFCMFMSAVLAMLTSATAAGAAMLPMIIAISKENGISRSRLLKPVIDAGCMGFAIMPFGLGTAFWEQGNSYLKALGAETSIGMFDSAIARIPVLLVTIIFMGLVGYKLLPDRKEDEKELEQTPEGGKSGCLSPVADKLGIIIFFGSIIAMIIGSVTGISSHYTAIAGAALMILCNVLNGKEAFQAVDLNTVCIYAGSISYAIALTKTQIADWIANNLSAVTSHTMNQFVIVGIFLLVPFLLTQFMGNIPVINLTMPIAAIVAVNTGMNPIAIMVATVAGATLSIATPMSAGIQTLIMEPGGYRFTDYLKEGVPASLVFIIAYIIWLPLVFPLY